MTAYEANKIKAAISDCVRYIEREEKRNDDLRPADVQKRLEWMKSHKAKLEGMLA